MANQAFSGPDLGKEPTFDAVKNIIPLATDGHKQLIKQLESSASAELADLTMDTWTDWLRPLRATGLALILDQAEELYTTYGYKSVGLLSRTDHGAPASRDSLPGAEPSDVQS